MIRRLSPAFLLLLAVLAVPAPAPAVDAVPQSHEQVKLTFAPVVKKAVPAVVNIFTKRTIQRRAPMIFNDPFFRQFFGDSFGPGGGERQRIQNSLGSGVIVRANGIVITNNHVIEGADEITIVLSDRRELAAKVVGTDVKSDLAVLQIQEPGGPLPYLELGDSDAIEIGDMVLAIGNPFGVGQTVTSGIVSALARSNAAVSEFGSYIQTDAAINPGNSGGALITSEGSLVGINTAIYSQSGGSIGIGFATPSNLVRTVLTGILNGGKAVRPWLGANGQSVSTEIAKALGMSRPVGVVIQRVVNGSPAARAGMTSGDIVLAVNGKAINDDADLKFTLATLPVGGSALFTVNRGGKERMLSMVLEAPPDRPAREVTKLGGRQPFAGATIANLNPALAEELSISYDEAGVMVISVDQGSIASRVGVQPGDRIVELNGAAIGSVSELQASLASPAQDWTLTLNRGGQILRTTIGG